MSYNPLQKQDLLETEPTNQPMLESKQVKKDEEEFRVYGDKTIYVYNKSTKKITSKPTEDTPNPLRYLSKYYPPPPSSFGNMFRYVMYKIPLGGTKRKRKRSKTKHRK